MAILSGACAGGSDEVPLPATDSTTAEAQAAATTAAPTTEPAATSALETLEQQWAAVWAAAGAVEADKPAAIEAVTPLVSPELAQQMSTVFGGEIERIVEHHPRLTENDDGTVSISDCFYVLPAQVMSITNWYEGVAEPDGAGGWTITSIESRSLTGCVPATVAEEVFADYAEFWAARFEYWNPAQPDHPGVDGTMTGAHRERILGLLQQHQSDGWYVVQDGRVSHPEILRVENTSQIVVYDCQLTDQERGLFDADGNRQEGVNPAVPDQRDIYQVTMVFEEDQWKISDIQLQEDVECEFAPTPQGVPQV